LKNEIFLSKKIVSFQVRIGVKKGKGRAGPEFTARDDYPGHGLSPRSGAAIRTAKCGLLRRSQEAFDGDELFVDRIDSDTHGFKRDSSEKGWAVLLTEDHRRGSLIAIYYKSRITELPDYRASVSQTKSPLTPWGDA